MVIYTSPIAGTSENHEGRIIVDESDYRLVDEKLPFETKDVVRIRAKEKFSKLYECFDVIGEGKFGKVYRCRERESGLELAAKRIKIKRDADRQQVEKEVAIMTQMRHPRIAQIYDAFSTPENDIVLVMEVVPGGELFDRVVQENYILTELAVVMIICQLCEAVDYIHSKHIVHLDIKPENIMCVSQTSNRIKLIDFGLAQYYDGSSNLLFMAGTPEFVAPEVIKFEPLDFHTDMWSIGVITYILLSGISPFLGETLGETYCAVEKGDWEFDEECFEGISKEAKDFISKLLVYDQKKRMLPADCLQHAWIVQARARTACRSPVCAANEGKPISKETLRSYIKNQRFRRATWAVLFLMRFKKFGHIMWPAINKASITNSSGMLEELRQNGIALNAKVLEQLPCVLIESDVNITKTDKNDGSDKRQVNIEVQETIARPINLLEKQIQGIKLKAPVCDSSLCGPVPLPTKTAKLHKTKTVELLSDYRKLSTELRMPIKPRITASFRCFKHRVQIQLNKKSKIIRIRKSLALKQRINIQQTIRLQKPIRKEFCLRAKAVNKCANIIIAKCSSEHVFTSIRIQNRPQKRSVKRRSLVIPSKLTTRNTETCDLNNNHNNSTQPPDKFATKKLSSLKNYSFLNRAEELKPSEAERAKDRVEEVVYDEELTNKQKLLSLNETILTAPISVKVSKRIFVAEKLHRTRGIDESSSNLKQNSVDMKIVSQDATQTTLKEAHRNYAQHMEDSEQMKPLDFEKNLGKFRSNVNSNSAERTVKKKKTQIKKLENVGTEVDENNYIKGLGVSDGKKSYKAEKSSDVKYVNTLLSNKKESAGLSSTLNAQKVSTRAVAVSKLDDISGVSANPTMNKTHASKEQKKTDDRKELKSAVVAENCQRTFKIVSNLQQQNSVNSCCHNFYKNDRIVQRYPKPLQICLKEPQSRVTASQKRFSCSKTGSSLCSSSSEEQKSVSYGTMGKRCSLTAKQNLNKQEEGAQLTQSFADKQRTSVTGRFKVGNENVAKTRRGNAKCKMPVIVSDKVPPHAICVNDEVSESKATSSKSKTRSSLEWLKSRLERNFKLDESEAVNENRKSIEVPEIITNNAQKTLKMWKIAEKSNGSVQLFNPLKVV